MTGPHPRRIDLAHVHLDSDALTAHGTSLASDCTLDHRLATGPRHRSAEPVESEGGALIRYASERFSTTLEVDATGLVVNDPGLGRRIEFGAPAVNEPTRPEASLAR